MQLFSLTSCMIAKVREKVKKFKDCCSGANRRILFFFKLFLVFGFIEWVLSTPQNSFQGGVLFNHFSLYCFSCSRANKKKLRKYNSKFWNIFPLILFKNLDRNESSCYALFHETREERLLHLSNNDDQNLRFCNFHCSLASFYDLINKVSFRTIMTMMKRFSNWL